MNSLVVAGGLVRAEAEVECPMCYLQVVRQRAGWLGGGGGGANYPVYESSVVAGLLVAGGQCCYIAPEQVSDNQPRLDQTATTSNQPSTFYILNGSVSYEFIFNITSSAINLHI